MSAIVEFCPSKHAGDQYQGERCHGRNGNLDRCDIVVGCAGDGERLVHLAPALDEFDDLLSNPCVLRLRVPKLAAPLEEGCNLIFDLDMPLATS